VDFFCHAPFHILEGFHDLAMLHTYIHKQKTQITKSTHAARDMSLRTCFENFTRSPTSYPKILTRCNFTWCSWRIFQTCPWSCRCTRRIPRCSKG
jgi:hypothetical protein